MKTAGLLQEIQVFVTDISQKKGSIELKVTPDAAYDPAKIAPFVAAYKGKLKLCTGAKPYFVYRLGRDTTGLPSSKEKVLDICVGLCEDMKSLVVDG